MRRRQRRMKANPSGPSGLALQGASAALRGLGVESTTPGAARLASAPLQSQRGSRGILRQAPNQGLAIANATGDGMKEFGRGFGRCARRRSIVIRYIMKRV